MQHVLSLIVDPAVAGLDERLAATIVGAIEALGARTGAPDWLSPGVACEIPFAGVDRNSADAGARKALDGAPVDIVVQPAAGRRKSLLVSDMESTIIENEMVDDLAAFVGAHEQVAEITRQAMRGEILFRPALRQRVALLAGLDEAMLAPACDAITYMPGARELVRTMRANGAYTALVSGGFGIFTTHVREALGFEFDLANILEIVDGRLTGHVAEPILGRDAKLDALLKLADERGLGPEDAVAVGDGFNDLPMIEAAGIGVAFRAKPAVAEAAGARIDYGDLTALLYIQGYRDDEIVR